MKSLVLVLLASVSLTGCSGCEYSPTVDQVGPNIYTYCDTGYEHCGQPGDELRFETKGCLAQHKKIVAIKRLKTGALAIYCGE